MRKLLLVIAVLFTTGQVFAQTVTLSVEDEGDGWAAIRYSADANVSGFGLKVTADSGAIFTDINDYNVGECTASQKGYGIFPGTIDVNEDTGVVDDNGTPVAPNDAPGAEDTGLDTNTLVLEMGALYVEGNEPPTSGTLALVKVNQSCTVCVEGEPIRGNIVMTDGTAVEANDCNAIVLVCTVPNVVGMSDTDANAAVEANGFTVVNSYDCNDTYAEGIVISTDPIAGSEIACGSEVDVKVSTGPTTCDCPTCPGDLSGDNRKRPNDVGELTARLLQAGSPYRIDKCKRFWHHCGDLTGDNRMRPNDVGNLVGQLINKGSPYRINCDDVNEPCYEP